MIRINLLPPEYRPQPQVRLGRLLSLLGLVALIAGLIGGAVYAWSYREALLKDIEMATQKRIEFGPLYDKVVGMEKTLAAIDQKLAGRQKLVDGLLDPVGLMKAMEESIPTNVAYNSFTINPDRSVAINGVATDYAAIGALQLKLSLNPVFAGVIFQSATKGGQGTVSFSLTGPLRKGGAPQ